MREVLHLLRHAPTYVYIRTYEWLWQKSMLLIMRVRLVTRFSIYPSIILLHAAHVPGRSRASRG